MRGGEIVSLLAIAIRLVATKFLYSNCSFPLNSGLSLFVQNAAISEGFSHDDFALGCALPS